DFDKLLVVKRNPKQLGLPQNWQGNCALARNGYDNQIAVLSPVGPQGKLTTLLKPAKGEFVGDINLHFDGDKMLFSMPGPNNRWQCFEMKADGTGLRQVTTSEYPDIDNYYPCYLPDGRIIFSSTGCFHGVPCVGGANWVANLFIQDADGKNMRQLCFDQDHDWYPVVMNDGRVLYTRWEYSDTAHYFTRILMRMNPDGSGQMEYYGSQSYWPNSLFYAKSVPNHSSKIVAIVSGHHGVPRMGELVILDPALGRHEGDGVVQRIPGYGKKVEPIIRDTLVDGSWPKFLHPYPLSDKYILVSCQPTPRHNWGIYLVDVFDNMLPLCDVPGYAMLEPIPLRKTKTPPAIPDRVKLESREATVYLSDIYTGPGLKDIPRGAVKSLRLSEPHYTYPQMGGHINIGIEGPWDVRRVLGTVPVQEDGSAAFEVPANTPITIQPLDAEGRSLQIMRSWFVAMPGEQISCIGCHEKQNTTPPAKRSLAMLQPASKIKPWYGPARGFSFKRDMQLVLDKFCVGCHNGQPYQGKNTIDLAAKPRNGWGNFTPSYIALHPFVRRPGPESDDRIQVPMEFHTSTSELVQMLEKGHYNVKLDAEAWDRLYTWIDQNVPDHGTWTEHRGIPGNYHKRRLEMRTKYAFRPEDPEVIPDIKHDPVQFVKPEPLAEVKQPDVACPGWPFDAAEAGKRQKAGGAQTRQTVDLANGAKVELALIPAGEFVMGGLDGYPDERPLARVKVDKSFWMGVMEISNAQYACFDPTHDSGFMDQQHKDHTTPGYPANLPNQPVIRVRWTEALGFCRWLSEKTGRAFTLPTEAQWEWACRAGTNTPFFYGNLDTDFGTFANLADQSIRLLAVDGVNPQPVKNPNPIFQDFTPKDARFNDGEKIQANVGKYKPSPWGLQDMHGNVWEWTRTTFKPYPYNDADGRNDLKTEGLKVVRGGSWIDRPARARSSMRLAYKPYQPVFNVGFRVVCPVVSDTRVDNDSRGLTGPEVSARGKASTPQQ
ncbi:MAG: SUMF1/EgtB/PvdO family nonheme iron enzyme, partial [Planctomycetota bacterium]|nr:SUMF1/EgtB/PvdO family nonheme iron enzyme [Planctomycetota bacterium]